MGLRGLFAKGDDEREYIVTDRSGISHIGSNRILGDTALLGNADKSRIVFRGSGNILYLEKGIKHLRFIDITFSGDNSLIYISNSKSEFTLKIEMEDNAVCYLGPQLYTSKMKALAARIRTGDKLIIGTDCMLSFGIEIDTKHPDGTNHGDIMIGNHVWIGQSARIYGGSVIGSGALIGAQTVVDGARCPGNACWVIHNGEFTKIYDNIVFTKDSMKAVRQENLEHFDNIDDDTKEKILRLTSRDPFDLAETLERIATASGRLRSIRKLYGDISPPATPLINDHLSQDKCKACKTDDADNVIIGNIDEREGNTIVFEGKGNILFIEPGVIMKNCHISFHRDNSLVYLSSSDKVYNIRLYLYYGTTVYFGRNIRFSKKSPLRVNASEAKCVLIGNNVRFGKRVWMRTSDQHPVYDFESGRRLNSSKNVVIGNGTLIDDDTVVRKGSIFSGKSGKRPENLIKTAEEINRIPDIEARLELLKIINNA